MNGDVPGGPDAESRIAAIRPSTQGPSFSRTSSMSQSAGYRHQRRRVASVVLASIPLVALGAIGSAFAQADGTHAKLLAAVEANAESEVRRLLSLGMDVNTADPDGNTLLMLAARRANREVALLLMGAGARLVVRNRFGETPLLYAALGGSEGIVRELLARGVDAQPAVAAWAPMHYAAMRGHVGIMALLAERGASVDFASENGTTPLMLASGEGRIDAVSFLLRRGADAARTNQAGRSAADFARIEDRQRILDLLVKAGGG